MLGKPPHIPIPVSSNQQSGVDVTSAVRLHKIVTSVLCPDSLPLVGFDSTSLLLGRTVAKKLRVVLGQHCHLPF